ncbi:unnamed protein product [Effrenium voratum]|nr:unnamed protein product [Effrenium voratum]
MQAAEAGLHRFAPRRPARKRSHRRPDADLCRGPQRLGQAPVQGELSAAGSVCTFEHIVKYSADEDIEACLEFATDHRPPILFKLLESVPVCRLLFLKDGPRMARRIIRKVGSLWPKVLEKLLWSPKDLVACLAAAPNLSRFEAENMRVFWQLDFENRWHGMALLSDSVRTVRFASEVFRFTTDLDSDKKCKLDLLQRLKQYQDADHEAPRAVCLRVLPYDPDDVTNVEMIKAIVATRNQEMLDTQFVSAVLDDAWNSIWPWYYWHTSIALLQVVCICLSTWNLSYGGRPHYLFAAFLLFGVVKRGIEEVWQAVLLVKQAAGKMQERRKDMSGKLGRQDLLDMMFDVLFDWVYLIFSSVGLGCLWDFGEDPDPGAKLWVAIYFSMVWLSFLYWLRGLELWGFNRRLLPILRAMQGSSTFLTVVALTFCAAAHSYYILGQGRLPRDGYGGYRAFERTFRLGILGDFDLTELEFIDPVFSGDSALCTSDTPTLSEEDPQPTLDYIPIRLFFYLVAVGITVVEMNLFIGVLSNAYDDVAKKGSRLATRERARLVLFIRQSPFFLLYRALCPCRRCCCRQTKVQTLAGDGSESEWLSEIWGCHDRGGKDDAGPPEEPQAGCACRCCRQTSKARPSAGRGKAESRILFAIWGCEDGEGDDEQGGLPEGPTYPQKVGVSVCRLCQSPSQDGASLEQGLSGQLLQ